MKCYVLLASILLSLFAYSCSDDNIQLPLPLVDEHNNGFENFEVAEVLAKNCTETGCHVGRNAVHSLSFETYSEMIKGSIGRPLNSGTHTHLKSQFFTQEGVYGGSPIIPFNAENSLMYRLITGDVENSEFKMPYMKEFLNPDEINIIKTWINNGAKDFQGNIPYSNSEKIYVCSQGSDKIYEVDSKYLVVSRIIDVDFNSSLIESPHNIQRYGNYIYVTLIGSGRLLKIDMSTNSLAGSVDGIEKAGMIAISPDGKTAYVSRSSSAASIYNTVYAVNTENMTLKGTINLPVTGLPHAIWLTKDGSTLYIANMSKDRISIVDAITLEFKEDIVLANTGSVVYEPMHIYLSPDDKYLYVNCRTSSSMLIISTETKQVVQEIPIKDHPMQSAVTSDGGKIYVVSHHDPYITEITKSGESWSITKEFTNPAFQHLYGADLSPDDKFLYVTCSNVTNDFSPRYKQPGKERASLVCVYDTKTGDLVKVIDAGFNSTGISARQNWK